MRALIQNKLEELETIECGEIISDDIIEDDVTYFGYQVNKNFINSDFNQNHTYRVLINGYVTRRIKPEENTTEIVDSTSEEIINKLKELNFKCNSEDISIDNNIKKMKINGHTIYNEINNKLII